MRFQTLFEGRHIFAVLLILAALFFWLGWIWAILLPVLGMAFCLNFFRDPERAVPGDESVVVAAADGVIDGIIEVEEDEVLKTKCRRVSIFLSVFDVHVNRAPMAGKIIYTKHY